MYSAYKEVERFSDFLPLLFRDVCLLLLSHPSVDASSPIARPDHPTAGARMRSCPSS